MKNRQKKHNVVKRLTPSSLVQVVTEVQSRRRRVQYNLHPHTSHAGKVGMTGAHARQKERRGGRNR